MADGDGTLDQTALATLVPRLAFELLGDAAQGATIHESVDGSLLSADISGFTRLTEALASNGRVGAEIITRVVNSCLSDLIEVGEHYGGDVLKFGGDAVLLLFTGPDHEQRAVISGREMQYALRKNASARRHSLSMTVGVSNGPFSAMVVGETQRDLLLCGAAMTRTLQLENAASEGEVVAAESMARSIAPPAGHGGLIVHADRSVERPPTPELDPTLTASLLAPSLLAYYQDYANLGAEHRTVAVGFVSIGRVDELIEREGGQRTAEQLSELVVRVFGALDSTGVTLLHSDMAMGGVKLLIGAGVPLSVGEPNDALVHAALAIAAIDSPFTVRLGLNVGHVFAGFLGASHRRTFTVFGDAVNTAARMLQAAGPGEIIAVATVARRARGTIEGTPLAPFKVKGKTQPVAAVSVHGITYGSEREAPGNIGFFGREPERQRLEEVVARQGSASVVGSAGAGKTRLRTETIRGAQVLAGTAGKYLTATPYGPFWVPMRRIVGIDPTMSSPDAGRALTSFLANKAPELAGMASLIAPVFGAELDETPEAAAIDPAFRRDVVHRLVVDLLSRHEPSVSVIVVEDTQWLDDASRELLAHLKAVSRTQNWAIVLTLRGDESPQSEAPDAPLPNDPDEIRILLGPLSNDAIEAIITDACPRHLDRAELDRLVRQAEGNPLFAIELGLAAISLDADLPGTVEELIMGRIDRLPAQKRRSVRLASVLGARFDSGQFAALVQARAYDLEPDLANIDEIFLIHDDGVAEFRQLLYRDAVYASLPFSRRKRLHREIADYIETSVDDVDAYSSLLSEHFRLAEVRSQCWRYSVQAAERARRAQSPVDAELLYRRAVDFAPRGLSGDHRARAFQGLGECLMKTGSLEEAYGWFSRARRATESQAAKLSLMGLQGTCRERQGRYSDAIGTYRRVINASAGFPAAKVAALNGRASVHYHQGRFSDCLDEANEALQLAQQTSLLDEQVHSYQLLHIAAEALGQSDAGLHADSALAVARECGALSAEAEVLNNVGVSHHVAGELDQAAEAYRRSYELKDRVGDRAGSAMVQMNLAEVELDRGVIEGVVTMLRSSLAEFDATGYTLMKIYSEGLLGRHSLAAGDQTDAIDRLSKVVSAFEENSEKGHQAYFELILLEAQVEVGDTAASPQTLIRVRSLLEEGAYDSPETVVSRIERLSDEIDAMSTR